MNLSIPTKKGSASQSTMPKPAKKGDDSSKTCLDIVPFEGSLNIVLESSPPPSAHTHSSSRPTASKSRPVAPWPSADALPSSRTQDNKKKTSPPSYFLFFFLGAI